jgi:hypothetical protein
MGRDGEGIDAGTNFWHLSGPTIHSSVNRRMYCHVYSSVNRRIYSAYIHRFQLYSSVLVPRNIK